MSSEGAAALAEIPEHISSNKKTRVCDKPFEAMSFEELMETLNLKGYRSLNNYVAKEKMISTLRGIEEGEIHPGNMPSFVRVLSAGRYALLEKIHYLKQRKYITSKTVTDTEICDAYACLKAGREVPDNNRCRPDVFNKRTEKLAVVSTRDLALFEKHGFLDEDMFVRYSAIYKEFVVKRTPREEIKKRYDIDYDEIQEAVKKIRSFLSDRFVPQDQLADALEEGKRSLHKLYEMQSKASVRLAEFDHKTENSYYSFIETYFPKNSEQEQVVIKGIARERALLVDSTLKIGRAIADEKKSLLELQGLLGGPVNLLQLNIVNNQNNPSAKNMSTLLNGDINEAILGGFDGQEVADKSTDVFDYEKYIGRLSPEDKSAFERLLDKMTDLYFDDIEASQNEAIEHTREINNQRKGNFTPIRSVIEAEFSEELPSE